MSILLWAGRAFLLSALLGIAALSAESALRGRKLASRWVWVAALVLSALLPVITTLASNVWPDALRKPAMFTQAKATPAASSSASFTTITEARAQPTQHPQLPTGAQIAGAAWLSLSAYMLFRYLHGWLSLARARRRWSPTRMADGDVLVSEALGPAVVGIVRAQLVVPSWVLGIEPNRQSMIVLHEREHVRAGDHLLLALAPLFTILFPWNAALWWQQRRLRLAIECDCDARVLRAGVAASSYGSLLLDIAASPHPLNPALAGLIEPRSLLQRRIEAMKSSQLRQSLIRACSLLGAALVALGAALLVSVPAATPVIAQERPVRAKASQAGEMLYVVDGKVLGRRSSLDAVASNLNVSKIMVLSAADARTRYGADGANGAILITTQRPATRAVRVREPERVEIVQSAMPVVTAVTAVPVVTADTAITVNLSGQARAVRIDRETLQDQVSLRLRDVARATDVFVVDGVVQPTRSTTAAVDLYQSRLTSATQKARPLFVIDELIVADPNLVELLQNKTIESVDVLKGNAALERYGTLAKDGVIIVKTRRN